MNILLIGLRDCEYLSEILNDTLESQNNNIYQIDNIENASKCVGKLDIDFFFCDLSLQEEYVEEFVDDLGVFNTTYIRGCYIYDDVVNNKLVIQAINTSLFNGIVQRPINKEKILDVWNNYFSDKWVKKVKEEEK